MEGLKIKYDNSTLRRQDRLMDYNRAVELLQSGEYGFLALGGSSGYGIPVNFILDGECIYIHCAPEGEKLRRIAMNRNASFCVVGYTEPVPSKFSTIYESVLVFGKIGLVTDDLLRMKALEAFVGKYSPDFKETGRKYAEKSFYRTAILCLEIERISGKCKYLVKLPV